MPRTPRILAFRLLGSISLLLLAASCEDEDTDVASVPEYESVSRGETHAHVAGTASEESVTISPTTAELSTDGDMVSFAASGGTSNYTWSVSDVFRGTIVDSGGRSAVYQRTAAGDNSVILEASDGRKAYAVVNQP